MNKTHNYDTKSSVLSIDYKIPYEISQSSRIVQHLEQSQQQLEFLKQKLTEAYEKLQKQININMELSDNNENLQSKVEKLRENWESEMKENKKLKEVMETMMKNRRLVQEEIEYTHKRYKKLLQEKDEEYQGKIEELEKCVRKLKRENETLEESLQERSRKDSLQNSKVNQDRQRKLQQKIQILESQLKKLTTEKVTQITRLKHEISCYQRNLSPSPIRTSHLESKPSTSRPQIEYFDLQSNTENTNINIMQASNIVQSKLTVESTKGEEDSVSKWNKKVGKSELTDDQRLTRAQMEKKKIQSQLIKIQRLKRHAPEDREAMGELQRKIYELDSEISGLKRKIRQKY